MELTALLIVAYFGVLGWAMRQRHRVIQGPWLFMFRAFFPNWQFYHGLGQSPRLWVRGQTPAGDWTDWHLVYPRVPRQLSHLFHNPAVNLALTQQNWVDHLSSDIHDLPEGADVQQRVTYQLVTRLAHDAIRGGRWGQHGHDAPMISAKLPDITAFQFEVRLERLGTDRSELLLQSPVVPVWT
jgi:hypothetical protein